MEPERWQRVKHVFSEALDAPEAARGALVDRLAGDDPVVRDETLRLLRQHAAGSTFLDRGAGVHAEEMSLGARAGGGFSPGDSIGPYRLERVLGEGGFGIVFLAEQSEPVRRPVALKVIRPGMGSRAVIDRFEAERQVLAMMEHPSLATVFDAGTTPDGRPYFVMEYVAGDRITDYCDRENLPIRARLELFIAVCDAIQHAHDKGILHRDVKPSNVLVTCRKGGPEVKVIDFGVAKALHGRVVDQTIFTEQGQLIGTPAYMSPEQAAMGATSLDVRSDVYSLGVLLYELLCGGPPFDLRGAGLLELPRLIRDLEPKRASDRVASLPEDEARDVASHRGVDPSALASILRRELEWIPLRAMRKERVERYRGASQLAEDVRNYLDGRPLLAGPETASYRARKFIRRHRGPVAAGAAILATLVIGLGATLVALAGQRAQRHRAEDALVASDTVTGFLVETIEQVDRHGPGVTVREAFEPRSASIEAEFAHRPDIRSRLHEVYARVYRVLGLHAEALEHGELALLALEETEPSPERLEQLRALEAGLVRNSQSMGRDAEADRWLAERAESSAAGMADLADLDSMSLQAHNVGDYELAEYHRLEHVRRVANEGTPDERAASMTMLAWLLVDQGRHDDAAVLIDMADDIRERRDHAAAFSRLAAGYAALAANDARAAARLFDRSRVMYRDIMGTDDTSLVAVAELLRWGVALDWDDGSGTSILPFDRGRLGDMDILYSRLLRNNARLLHRQGRIVDGDRRFGEAVAADAEREGRALSIAHTEVVWGELLLDAGSLDAAGAHLEASLAALERAPGVTITPLARVMAARGRLRLVRGEARSAAADYVRAIGIREQGLANGAWPIACLQTGLGACMIELDRHGDAADLLDEAAARLRDALGPDDHRTRLATRLLETARASREAEEAG